MLTIPKRQFGRCTAVPEPILDAALSKHAQVQASAIDVLTFTIKQGLAHPLQAS